MLFSLRQTSQLKEQIKHVNCKSSHGIFTLEYSKKQLSFKLWFICISKNRNGVAVKSSQILFIMKFYFKLTTRSIQWPSMILRAYIVLTSFAVIQCCIHIYHVEPTSIIIICIYRQIMYCFIFFIIRFILVFNRFSVSTIYCMYGVQCDAVASRTAVSEVHEVSDCQCIIVIPMHSQFTVHSLYVDVNVHFYVSRYF